MFLSSGNIKKQFKKDWDFVDHKDRENIALTLLPKGVHEEQYAYKVDQDSRHIFAAYWPENRGATELPLIIDVHGGGWMYGDYQINRPFCMTLASFGFGVVGMNYCLAPKAKLKEMIQDIYDSLIYLWQKRAKFPFDFSKVFLTGDSAGAHLASVLIAVQEDESLQKVFGIGNLPFTFKAVCLNHPAINILTMTLRPRDNKRVNQIVNRELVRELYGPWYKRDKEIYEATISFDKTLSRIKSYVPTIIVTSTGDKGLNQQSHQVYEELQKYGVEAKLHETDVKPRGHVFNLRALSAPVAIETNKAIVDFFFAHCPD